MKFSSAHDNFLKGPMKEFCSVWYYSWKIVELAPFEDVHFGLFFYSAPNKPWPPHAVAGSLFINPLCTHIVFERSTNREWLNPPGTFSVGQCGSLEQVAWVLVIQKENLSVNN